MKEEIIRIDGGIFDGGNQNERYSYKVRLSDLLHRAAFKAIVKSDGLDDESDPFSFKQIIDRALKSKVTIGGPYAFSKGYPFEDSSLRAFAIPGVNCEVLEILVMDIRNANLFVKEIKNRKVPYTFLDYIYFYESE